MVTLGVRIEHRRGWAAWTAIGLIAAGAAWPVLRSPHPLGWGAIVLGFLLLGAAEPPLLRTPLDPPLTLLVLMAGVSLIVTAFPETTTPAAARLAASVALTYGLISWARTRTRLRGLGLALALIGSLLALVAPFIVDWLSNKPFLIPAGLYDHFPLLVGDTVHPNMMAAALILLLPLPTAWMLHAQRLSPRLIVPGVLAALMATTLVLTKSRGGYIAAAIAVTSVTWLSRRRRWAVGLGALAVVAAAFVLLSGRTSDATELVTGAADPSTLAFRLTVWRTALWMVADFPFTGAGMGTFNDVGALLYPFYEVNNPGTHNWYLQVGVDLGIPGLIALLATLMLTLWLGAKALRAFSHPPDTDLHALTAGALAGLIGLMAHGLVDNTLWNSRAALLPWAVIALLIALYRWSERPAAAQDARLTP